MNKYHIILCLSALLIGSASFGMNYNKLGDKLCDAAINGNMDKVKALLAAGVSADSKNAYGNSALGFAVMWRRKDICELLITSKAQVEAKDDYGKTVLMRASSINNEEIARGLINVIIKLSKRDHGLKAVAFAIWNY
jgi:ankyrin repeat protein